jgi:hypothetical protein
MRSEGSGSRIRDTWLCFRIRLLIRFCKPASPLPPLFQIPKDLIIEQHETFLHHAQTDRLIALWQAINPTSFMTPDIETEGGYTVAVGQNITADTPLGPFYMGDGKTPYTSESARRIADFGYSYPGLEDVS